MSKETMKDILFYFLNVVVWIILYFNTEQKSLDFAFHFLGCLLIIALYNAVKASKKRWWNMYYGGKYA